MWMLRSVQVWMSVQEISLVRSFIKPHHQYLEWGTGGSTLTFAPIAKHAYSIEHDADWCTKMQATLKAKGLSSVEFHCVVVDPGWKGVVMVVACGLCLCVLWVWLWLWLVACGLWIVDCGLWIVDCSLWFVVCVFVCCGYGCGLWVVGCGCGCG